MIGAVIHLIDGALLGIAWAYGTVVFESPQWGIGLVWGLILWALALIMVNTIGSVHPAIRRGEQRNPAGSVAKATVLIPNIVYGAVLDGLYHVGRCEARWRPTWASPGPLTEKSAPISSSRRSSSSRGVLA